jgi:hypothetical protein
LLLQMLDDAEESGAGRRGAPVSASPIESTLRQRPTVVCLCGSTRFYETFQRANYVETMAGRIVLSVGFYPHSREQAHGEAVGCTPEQKAALDELHLRKIDLADEVLILNVGCYVGESTRRELDYARVRGKSIRFLENPGDEGLGICRCLPPDPGR